MGHDGHHHHGHHHHHHITAHGHPGGHQQHLGNGGAFGTVLPYPQAVNHLHAREQKHKRHEHLAEAVALGAGALAAYEHHQVKADPAHAARHRREEHMAEAAALGAGGFVLYEHHQHHKHEKKHHRGLFH